MAHWIIIAIITFNGTLEVGVIKDAPVYASQAACEGDRALQQDNLVQQAVTDKVPVDVLGTLCVDAKRLGQ